MANVETGWLKNDTGEKFAPKTFPSQVIMRDGKTLEDSDIAYIDETDSDFIEDVEEENTDLSAKSNTILVPVEASGFVLNETTGRYEQTVSVVGMTEGNGGMWDIVRSGSVLTEEEAEIVANITDVERLENGVKISCLEAPTQTYTLVLYGTYANSGETLVSSMPAWFTRVETVENKVGSADISGIGDGTVTGAISALNDDVDRLDSRTTFNYQTPTFQLYHCTGTINASYTQLAYSESEKTIQICGRIIISDLVKTGPNPGVYVELPFISSKSLEFCVSRNTDTPKEMIVVGVTKNSNRLFITSTETYSNVSNGTLILCVPLVTIQVP